MKKITLLFTALTLMATTLQAQTPIVFDFDTNASVNGSNEIIETEEGITLSVVGDVGNGALIDAGGWGGSSGNVAYFVGNTAVTFTFDQPVVINSVLALEGWGSDIDYLFTPTGGTGNDPVTASLVGGVATATLNWVNVTAFTVTTTVAADITFDDLSIYPSNDPTVFDFDTNAIDSFNTSSPYYDSSLNNYNGFWETIDGITLTATDDISTSMANYNGWNGTSGFVALFSNSEMEFSFSEPVVVNSVLALDGPGNDVTYLFTPTGGEGNEPIVVTLSGGVATVNFNWVGVTSFTVSNPAVDAYMNFDNLSVQSMQVDGSLSVEDPIQKEVVKLYPNPVQSTLYIKNSTDIESVAIYSITGQQVYKGNITSTIDVSNLSQGMYVLKLKTTQGTEVIKRIIKN